jgi:adenylate kinase
MAGLWVILMGVQGAGKGEQARFITQQYGIPQISTGDLFRAMRTREDAFAREIQALMASGALIDDATTNRVVAERLQQPDAVNGATFDGYPRTPAQAEWLDAYLAERGQALGAVILLEIDLFVAFKRAFGRVTAGDGRSYNYYYNRDDVTFQFIDDPAGRHPARLEATTPAGETLIRRMDDANAHAIIKRIDTFLEQTRPLIEFYERVGKLHRVNAEQSIEAVSGEMRAILDRVLR